MFIKKIKIFNLIELIFYLFYKHNLKMNEFEDEYIPEMNIPGMPPPMDGEETMFILNQLNKCCCKITSGKGSGFLCKIIFPNSTYLIPALITNNHVLGKDDISIGKKINFSLENDKFNYSLTIDDSRIVYTNDNNNFDCTIIEIKENDNLNIKSFLEIDEGIYDNDLDYYKSKSIYLLHYPKGVKAKYSYGNISSISIDNYTIKHKCSSDPGSSGGPLINLLNKKVIGIHKGCIEKNKTNLGTFFKPIIEDFYNVKIKKQEKIFNNIINKNQQTNISNYNQNNKILNKNLDSSLSINQNSFYYLILFLSICLNSNMHKDFSFVIYIIHDKRNDFDILLFYYFLFFCFDIILGICLFIIEIFLNHRFIIFLSLFLFLLNFPLSSIAHFLGMKMLKSSIFYIIPNLNNQIISAIIRGQIIANIILIFIYSKIKVEDGHPVDLEDIYIYYGYKILNSLTLIYTLTIFFYNNSLFNKISEKEKEKIKLNNYDIKYIKKKFIFNILIILNYCFSFSLYPLIDFLNNYKFTENAYIIFIIFDIIGRSLVKQFNKTINKGIFKATFLFRFILFFILSKFLDDEVVTINTYIYIVIMGILSGICTSFAYYYPLNIKKETKRDNFIYFMKSGKYYILFKLLDEPKLPSNEKKFH